MKTVVKAIIKKKGKILLIKRSPNVKYYPGAWDLPGGNPEQNEELNEAIKREVKEETGLIIDPIDIIWEKTAFVIDININFKLFSTRNIRGELYISHEHSEYMLADVKEIKNLKTTEFIQMVIKNIPAIDILP